MITKMVGARRNNSSLFSSPNMEMDWSPISSGRRSRSHAMPLPKKASSKLSQILDQVATPIEFRTKENRKLPASNFTPYMNNTIELSDTGRRSRSHAMPLPKKASSKLSQILDQVATPIEPRTKENRKLPASNFTPYMNNTIELSDTEDFHISQDTATNSKFRSKLDCILSTPMDKQQMPINDFSFFQKTSRGRMVKPRLNTSLGERITYDVDGNPLRVNGPITRPNNQPEITLKLSAICAQLKLQSPKESKQVFHAPPLIQLKVEAMQKYREEQKQMLCAKTFEKKKHRRCSSSDDSYFKELDRVSLSSHDEDEQDEGKEQEDDEIPCRKQQLKRTKLTSILNFRIINSDDDENEKEELPECTPWRPRRAKATKTEGTEKKEKLTKKKIKDPPEKKVKEAKKTSKNPPAAATKRGKKAESNSEALGPKRLRAGSKKNVIELDSSNHAEHLEGEGLLFQLQSTQPLCTSTPVGKGGGKGKSNKKDTSSFQTTIQTTNARIYKKRWNDRSKSSLMGVLQISGRPGNNPEKWWDKVAKWVGNGFSGEDCRLKAKQLGWVPKTDADESNHSTDIEDEVEGSFVENLNQKRRPPPPKSAKEMKKASELRPLAHVLLGQGGEVLDGQQPSSSVLQQTTKRVVPSRSKRHRLPDLRTSVEMDESYFRKHINASNDDLKFDTDDSIFALLAPTKGPTRAMRRPLHVIPIVDQNSTLNKTQASDESSSFFCSPNPR